MDAGDFFALLVTMVTLFVGLPWIILHHITKWKTASTLTHDDEAMLEELYQLARRLNERMDTVERLVANDHPEFRPGTPPEYLHNDVPLADEPTAFARPLTQTYRAKRFSGER